MRGLIRSGIISPVTGAVVTYAANEMFDWVNTELFGRRELDKLKAMADSLQLGGGVSAGENYGSDGKQEIDKTFLSYRADDIIEFIEKYQNFAKEYPTLAEYGLQALSLGLKGVYTLATGGTGLFALAANEAKGMLVSAVTSEKSMKGYLMLVFLALIIFITMKQRLQEPMDTIWLTLRNLKAKVFEDEIIIQEPNTKVKDIFSTLGKVLFALIPKIRVKLVL